jgi:hypothetical protein
MRIFPIMLPQTFYKIPYRPLTASPNIQLSRTKALGKARTKSASESSVLTLRQPQGADCSTAKYDPAATRPRLSFFSPKSLLLTPARLCWSLRLQWRTVMTLRRFVIERDIPEVGTFERDQLRAAAAKSNEALHGLGPDIQWVESFVAADKTFCVYLAKDEAIIREHARISGFPATKITEVRKMIDPTTAAT